MRANKIVRHGRSGSAAGTARREFVQKIRHPHLAWIMLAACCLVHLGVLGILRNSSSLFVVPVCTDLGFGRGEFSIQNTFNSVATCAMLPFTAKLYRKVPLRILITASALLSFVAVGLMSTFTQVYQWCIASVLLGLSGAICVSTLIPTLIGNWFKKCVALATAVASSFSGVGGSLFSPMISRLIEAQGWRASYLIVAIGCALIALPFTLFVIDLRPQDRGLLPYGATQDDAAKQPVARGVPNPSGIRPLPLPWLLLALSVGCVGLGSSFYQHAPSYADSIGYPASVGATLASVLMLGNIAGKVSVGWLSDKFGYRRTGIIPVFLSFIGIVGILAAGAKSQPLLVASSFLFGTVFCYIAVIEPVTLQKTYGPECFLSIFPIVRLIETLLTSLGSMIQGYIYDLTGSYVPALSFSLAMYVLGIVVYAVFHRMRKWPRDADISTVLRGN